jgi:hypothetical protein
MDDNIKTDLKEMACERERERVDCSGQRSVLGFCECGNKLWGSIIFQEFL